MVHFFYWSISQLNSCGSVYVSA
jgi:hypothetical protein